MFKKHYLVLSCWLAGSLSMPAMAAIEEVVVTATKREANIQDIPIAVTALSAVQLERAGVDTLRDLNRLSTSFSMNTTDTEAGSGTLRLRGVGTTGNNIGLEQSVGVFLDGVYLSRTGMSLGVFGGRAQGRFIKPAEAERIQTKATVVGLEVFFLPGGAIYWVRGTGIGFLTAIWQPVFFWGGDRTPWGIIVVIIGKGKKLAGIAGLPFGKWCHGSAGIVGFVFEFIAGTHHHPTGRRIVVVKRSLSIRARCEFGISSMDAVSIGAVLVVTVWA